MPTYHEKIMIAQEIQVEYEVLHHDIQQLIDLANSFDNKNIVSKMKQIIPEFKSMNSDFELLDKKTC